MSQIPFYDFDEAHRAENAKQMRLHESYFVPLTGSHFDRVVDYQIPIKDHLALHLFYHPERPFLVYFLMVLSTTIFNSDAELFYRLPSFLLGVLVFGIFIGFGLTERKKNFFALTIGLVALLTSTDLWLSAQYAQLDTGLTAFLFLAVLSLVRFAERKKLIYLFLSALGVSLAILSKAQPAVIFLIPLTILSGFRKISFRNIFLLALMVISLLSPWLIFMSSYFGFSQFLWILINFAFSTSVNDFVHHKAPFYWYARWWWEMFRPGWSLFLISLVYGLLDYKSRNYWQKLSLAGFVVVGLLIFSIPMDKLWWYVLPLVPIACYYIFLVVRDVLVSNHNQLLNISLIVLLCALPIFAHERDTLVLLSGMLVVLLGLARLNMRSRGHSNLGDWQGLIFCAVIFVALFFYSFSFPKIVPYHWETKPVAEYYSRLPGVKYLWVADMPAEAVLFYSNAGEVLMFNAAHPAPQLTNPDLDKYLITPLDADDRLFESIKKKELIYQQGSIKLFKI